MAGEKDSDVDTDPTTNYQVGSRVRVWWPPTKDKQKTYYAGMYWPVKILACESGNRFKVVYDNEETEVVKGEHLHPNCAPVDFGREGVPLQVGEFVEVHNDSEEDPAAWLAMIRSAVSKEVYLVAYPFHDEDDEEVPIQRLRRARMYDSETKAWVIIKPGQIWEDGEVESPVELETVTPKELAEYLQKLTSGANMGQGDEDGVVTTRVPPKGGVNKKQAKSPAGSGKRKSGRPSKASV